jgi:hypothetical protein
VESVEAVKGRLFDKYTQAIDLTQLAALAERSPDLAGLFVPSVSESYLTSALRVMIVGKETRKWGAGLAEVNRYTHPSAYVDMLLKRHANELAKLRPRSKFFQFYRDASKKLYCENQSPTDAIVWANLFCLSYRKRSPVKCGADIGAIKSLSRTLLRIQVEVLKPDVILFVTGTSYDKYLTEFFAIGSSKVIEPRALWSFKAEGIQAYRTSHPQWGKGRPWRTQALELTANLQK